MGWFFKEEEDKEIENLIRVIGPWGIYKILHLSSKDYEVREITYRVRSGGGKVSVEMGSFEEAIKWAEDHA